MYALGGHAGGGVLRVCFIKFQSPQFSMSGDPQGERAGRFLMESSWPWRRLRLAKHKENNQVNKHIFLSFVLLHSV